MTTIPRLWTLTMCSLILAATLTNAAAAGPTATGFLDKSVEVDGKTHPYALYVPADYDATKAWPMIVFLHGKGEQGDDNLKQTEVGIGRAIRLDRDRFPALVLMPQCREERFWDVEIPVIEGAMAQTQSEYTVDSKAITLTGLSLGGYATWIWGSMKTDTFAALMPICGGGKLEDLSGGMALANPESYGTFEERIRRLSTVPIWAFHGADDDVIPVGRTQEMVKLVKKAGGKVRYDELKDTNHNSWDQAYGNKRAMGWLLKQRKK